MTDPEPTLEYVRESQWYERLKQLGFNRATCLLSNGHTVHALRLTYAGWTLRAEGDCEYAGFVLYTDDGQYHLSFNVPPTVAYRYAQQMLHLLHQRLDPEQTYWAGQLLLTKVPPEKRSATARPSGNGPTPRFCEPIRAND